MNAALLAQQHERFTLVDVRTPSEYAKGHIPGAMNLPLFDDKERARVGTVYKREGRNSAVSLGLKIVGPKLHTYPEQAREMFSGRPFIVYCWRGGMRSASLAWLLDTAGFEVVRLEGGYKAFRKAWHHAIESHPHLSIIGGYTGSQKTEVLHALKAKGQQVIDLEGLARHKGSAFGGLLGKTQPNTEQFANEVGFEWLTFDQEKTVWIEDESKTIGSVWLSDVLFERMRTANVYIVDKPLEERAKFLAEGYGAIESERLIDGFRRIERRLGVKNVNEAIAFIQQNELAKAAALALRYYDKTYRYGLDRRKSEQLHRLDAAYESPETTANQLITLNDERFRAH